MLGVKDYSKSEYSQIAINGPVEQKKTKRTILICVCLLILLAGVLLTLYFLAGILEGSFFGGGSQSGPSPNGPSTTPPDAPTNFQSSNVLPNSISFSWSTPYDGGSEIINFHLQMKDTSDGPIPPIWRTAYKGRPTQATVSKLTASTNYCFRVAAVNSVAQGPFSNVSCLNTADPTVPNQCNPPEPTNTTKTSISVKFKHPNYDGGVSILYYLLQYKLTTDNQWNLAENGTKRLVLIDSLLTSREYVIRVCACNEVGCGNFSDSSYLHTDWPTATIPSQAAPPLGRGTATSISLNWNMPPTDDNGAQILRFIVAVALPTKQTIIYAGFETDHLFPNMPSNTTFCFVVAAQNSQGIGQYSDQTCITTQDASEPDTPVLELISTDYDEITVHWKKPNDNGAPISSYELQMDNWWTNTSFVPIFTGINQTYASNGLLPASTYHFRVRAKNSVGYSNWSIVTGFSTDDHGNCGNAQDIAIEQKDFNIVKGTIQQCLIGCVIKGTQCAIDCIADSLGFSQACAGCFTSMGVCALQNCAAACIDPTSDSCKTCTETYCFPACIACTGYPQWALPP